MENKKIEQPKVYEKNRFEFTISVNDSTSPNEDFVVCKRNFRIYNFEEGSFNSIEFRNLVNDKIVRLIKEDLNCKSRIYTWYNYVPDEEGEFTSPLPEPWSTTFKFTLTDNDRVVYEQIWDGSCYPKEIRQNVDIVNKVFSIGTSQNGDKIMVPYDKVDPSTLSGMNYVRYNMGKGTHNIADVVIKVICASCEKYNRKLREENTHTMSDTYGTKTYNFRISSSEKKLEKEKDILKKTRNYLDKECEGMF